MLLKTIYAFIATSSRKLRYKTYQFTIPLIELVAIKRKSVAILFPSAILFVYKHDGEEHQKLFASFHDRDSTLKLLGQYWVSACPNAKLDETNDKDDKDAKQSTQSKEDDKIKSNNLREVATQSAEQSFPPNENSYHTMIFEFSAQDYLKTFILDNGKLSFTDMYTLKGTKLR